VSDRRCDVAIIGAGTAGLHAYKAAVARGVDVIIIERGPGGSTCTRSGCIPSKLLIAAGRAAAQARRADVFGVDVTKVEVDGASVLHRLRSERDKADAKIRKEYEVIPAAHRLHGDARFTGPTTLAVDDVDLSAGSIIIAVGGSPDVPSFLDPICDMVRTSETIFEIEALPDTLAVIGGGPLGLELAQAFSRLGVRVTVLDASEQVGALKDPDCERSARAALLQGLEIHSGVEIKASRLGERARLTWAGSSDGTVEVDMVLAATGRTANLAGLCLENAGIELDDKGIPDFDHRTHRCGSSPVFIAGDAGGWRPVLHEAARGGTSAGAVAAGGEPLPTVPLLAIAFTEPNLVEVGTAFDKLPEDAVIGTALATDNARSGIDADDAGIVRLYADRSGRILGGSIVLTGGEHLGQALAVAIDTGMDAAKLAAQPWYHPCLEEMLQEAARDVWQQLSS
jgi:dihydrolipoamide dehydrogenase